MANDLQPWVPPQSKAVSVGMRWAFMAAIALGGMYLFKAVAPDAVASVVLADKLFSSLTNMALSGAAFAGVAWVIYEVVSPHGFFNKFILMFANSITRQMITIDPLSPIDLRIKQVQADKEIFETQFEKLDGVIKSIQLKKEDSTEKMNKAASRGQAAMKLGNKGAQDVAAHDFGAYQQAAQRYASMEGHILPMRATLQQVANACDVTIQKLQTERDILRDEWNIGQAVDGVNKSASRLLGRSRTEVWGMAEQAEQIINQNYGEELGHLDHLKSYVQPMLDSIDVDNQTFSDDMLKAANDSGVKMIASADATPLPLPNPGATIGAASDMSGLFH